MDVENIINSIIERIPRFVIEITAVIVLILKAIELAEKFRNSVIKNRDHKRYFDKNYWNIHNDAFLLVGNSAIESHSSYDLELSRKESPVLSEMLNAQYPDLSLKESRKS